MKLDTRITGMMLDGIRIRNYRDGDLPELVDLVNGTDGIEILDRGTSICECEIALGRPGFDPYRDLFVVEIGDGPVIGEAEVFLRQDERTALFFTWGTVHPHSRRQGVGIAIMNALWTRAQARAAELGLAKAQLRATHLAGQERGRQALFERFGMQQDRAFYRMVFSPLGSAMPQPVLPRGITIRSYVPGRDDAAFVAAMNEAFRDHWNHVEYAPEKWQHEVRSPGFRPELTLLAVADGEIAGICHNRIDEEANRRTGRKIGHVATLGVRRPWRKAGVGTALLRASLLALRGAGMESAQLGVDAENLTGAVRLYEQVGFRVSQKWLSYVKLLT